MKRSKFGSGYRVRGRTKKQPARAAKKPSHPPSASQPVQATAAERERFLADNGWGMRAQRGAADAMIEAINTYLRLYGWTILVMGDPRIQQQPTDRKSVFEFVVRFTGNKREEKK